MVQVKSGLKVMFKKNTSNPSPNYKNLPFQTLFHQIQGWTSHCGNVANAARLFFLECEAFFKNAWHFKAIFREFEAILKISIHFEVIFRDIEAFFN
jgi:hypothetical protein